MKTNLYNILGRNLDAENAGVWVALEHEGEVIKDVQFKLKSFASDAGDKYRDLYGKYEKSLGKESLGKAVADALIESGIVTERRVLQYCAICEFYDSIGNKTKTQTIKELSAKYNISERILVELTGRERRFLV